MRMQGLSLAQQIAQLQDPAPVEFDPEETNHVSGNDASDRDNDCDVYIASDDVAKGRQHYIDVRPSDLRRMQDSMEDPKYDSVRTSRRQLLEDESDDEARDGQNFDEGLERNFSDSESGHVVMDRSPENGDTRMHDKPSHSLGEATEASHPDQSLALSLRDTRAADKLKGKAVSRQLAIWDSLIDARIRLQKSAIASNSLPPPGHLAPFVSSPTRRVAAQAFLLETVRLSEELFELRHALLKQKDNLPPRKKRRIGLDAVETDHEALISNCTMDVMAFEAETHLETLTTLQKWSSKVQAVTPSALLTSSRTSFKGQGHLKNAVELVDEALHDQDKAVRRTWGRMLHSSVAHRTADDEDGDQEMFEDRDFFRSLLRDVIESKGGKDGLNVADLYVNAEKQKKKKSVDTKASKGRKLRYELHEKLQHFMVPVPARGAWHEEQIDELFASLLGRGFEELDVGANELATEEHHAAQEFRVFG